MIKLVAKPLLDMDKNAAFMRRLGVEIYDGQSRCLCFENSLSPEEKDALLSRADAENGTVLLCAADAAALEEAVLWVNLWRNRMCEPDELWDIYDSQGRRTGKLHRRAEPLSPDEYHLCVHVWVENSRGQFMLTKRSQNKSMPGLWESTGGSVVAGEDSFSAAIREVREETGIELQREAGQLLFRYGGKSFFCDVWLFRQGFELSSVRLLEGETCDVMAADRAKIRQLIDSDQFVPYDYIEDFIK